MSVRYQALAEVLAMMKKMEDERGEVSERELREALGSEIGPYPVKEVLRILFSEGIIIRVRKGIIKWS